MNFPRCILVAEHPGADGSDTGIGSKYFYSGVDTRSFKLVSFKSAFFALPFTTLGQLPVMCPKTLSWTTTASGTAHDLVLPKSLQHLHGSGFNDSCLSVCLI